MCSCLKSIPGVFVYLKGGISKGACLVNNVFCKIYKNVDS